MWWSVPLNKLDGHKLLYYRQYFFFRFSGYTVSLPHLQAAQAWVQPNPSGKYSEKNFFRKFQKKKIEFSANQQLFIQHLNYIRYYNNIEMIWSYERMCIGYMQILYFILGHLWTFLDFVTLWGKWGNPGTSPHRYQETTVIRKEKGFWCVFWFFFSLSLLKIILSLPI